jgi:hypothetical protein
MNIIPPTSQANAFTGLWFIFRDGNRKIAAHVSTMGRESVFIDGKLISKRKPVEDSSIHRFTLDRNRYEVSFLAINTVTINLECSLTKNNVRIEAFKACCQHDLNIRHPMSLPLISLFGLLVGLFFRSLRLPLPLLIILISISCCIVYLFLNKNKKGFVINRINVQ